MSYRAMLSATRHATVGYVINRANAISRYDRVDARHSDEVTFAGRGRRVGRQEEERQVVGEPRLADAGKPEANERQIIPAF